MTEDGWILSSGLTSGVSILDPLPGVGSRVWVDEPALLTERRYRVDRVHRCYSRRVSEASCAQSGSDSGLVTVVRVMACVCDSVCVVSCVCRCVCLSVYYSSALCHHAARRRAVICSITKVNLREGGSQLCPTPCAAAASPSSRPSSRSACVVDQRRSAQERGGEGERHWRMSPETPTLRASPAAPALARGLRRRERALEVEPLELRQVAQRSGYRGAALGAELVVSAHRVDGEKEAGADRWRQVGSSA